MGNLKEKHDVESPRKDLRFVPAHLSTNAKLKTEKVTKEYLCSAKIKMNYKEETT